MHPAHWSDPLNLRWCLRPRFELATCGLQDRCSGQLSYEGVIYGTGVEFRSHAIRVWSPVDRPRLTCIGENDKSAWGSSQINALILYLGRLLTPRDYAPRNPILEQMTGLEPVFSVWKTDTLATVLHLQSGCRICFNIRWLRGCESNARLLGYEPPCYRF